MCPVFPCPGTVNVLPTAVSMVFPPRIQLPVDARRLVVGVWPGLRRAPPAVSFAAASSRAARKREAARTLALCPVPMYGYGS